jgi:hypothetical protein
MAGDQITSGGLKRNACEPAQEIADCTVIQKTQIREDGAA